MPLPKARDMQDPIRLPAFTAYAEPDAEGHLSEKNALVWYGELKTTGPLLLALETQGIENAPVELHFFVERVSEKTGVRQAKAGTLAVGEKGFLLKTTGAALVSLGTVMIRKTGYYRFVFLGKLPGTVSALTLSGPATKDAHFNFKERCNAASVHLSYPLGKESQATWFYNEVTVKTEPLHSYYMACGFKRGYFGIQINSPTERRVIFSIWDSGNEGVDRNKVADADQVKLLAKGDGVVASGFGNEGTGGHSHLVYPWKGNQTYRFLVSAEPKGKQTIYSGYFFFPERNAWGLIARFRAPKDGNYLSGLYSFNENFWGNNGQLQRLAEFGPAWVKTADGAWQELTEARFTCDATGKAKDRLDFAAGLAPSGRWFLSNGGFTKNGVEYGQTLAPRKASGKPPEITLPG